MLLTSPSWCRMETCHISPTYVEHPCGRCVCACVCVHTCTCVWVSTGESITIFYGSHLLGHTRENVCIAGVRVAMFNVVVVYRWALLASESSELVSLRCAFFNSVYAVSRLPEDLNIAPTLVLSMATLDPLHPEWCTSESPRGRQKALQAEGESEKSRIKSPNNIIIIQ